MNTPKGMSSENYAIIRIIAKILNQNKVRGVNTWTFSHNTWLKSKQQLIYYSTRKRNILWVNATQLVNEFSTWQKDPKLALDFLSNSENKHRSIGRMICKHILEHG